VWQHAPMADPKLSFVIGGAQKAGTSTLNRLFRLHPEIQMARHKEPHFFDDEQRDWTDPSYDDLHAEFRKLDSRLRGESTPITLYWRPAIRRLHAYNPSVKLIFVLRDPVERTFSQWCKEYSLGRETLPFSQAIREGRARVRAEAEIEGLHRYVSYVERSLYGEQLQHALEYFPREAIHCEIFEELFLDRPAGLRRIARFLGIGPWPDELPDVHLNPRREYQYPSTLAGADREYLRTLFREDRAAVEALLGRKVTAWDGDGGAT
jgi:hypothetical protein